MSMFDKLYAITEEAGKALKKPFVRNKVQRALAGAADSYESEKIDTQEKIDKLLGEVANGATDKIGNLIEARLTLKEIDAQAAEALAVKAELFDE